MAAGSTASSTLQAERLVDLYDNPDIPVRHMDFKFSPEKMAKYCIANDPLRSAFILTYSAFIPEGERLVIHAIRSYRDEVTDPELKARINGLIGQEAMHSKVHEAFNSVYEAKGIPMKQIERAGTWCSHKLLPFLFSKRMMLSITCAIEHGTAQIAEFVFSNPERFDHLDESARDFCLWHLLEETEHKSVAFDLYQETVGSHYLRIAGWYAIHFVTFFLFIYSFALILLSPGYWPKTEASSRVKLRAILEHARRTQARSNLRSPVGARRNSRKRYFHKTFHPNHSNKSELYNHWHDKLFGENGTLNQYVTKNVLP